LARGIDSHEQTIQDALGDTILERYGTWLLAAVCRPVPDGELPLLAGVALYASEAQEVGVARVGDDEGKSLLIRALIEPRDDPTRSASEFIATPEW